MAVLPRSAKRRTTVLMEGVAVVFGQVRGDRHDAPSRYRTVKPKPFTWVMLGNASQAMLVVEPRLFWWNPGVATRLALELYCQVSPMTSHSNLYHQGYDHASNLTHHLLWYMFDSFVRSCERLEAWYTIACFIIYWMKSRVTQFV